MIFFNRSEAGKNLAASLGIFKGATPLVFSLPRGGVVVGYEVARVLSVPLEVLVVRKLGAPQNPELAIGALAEDGTVFLDFGMINFLGISGEQIETLKREAAEAIKIRVQLYRRGENLPGVQGRMVILVDDGLATGATAKAAIKALRQQKPEGIILAVPVCAQPVKKEMKKEVEQVICLLAPSDFRAVGTWYQHFEPVTDKEVIDLLERSKYFDLG